MNNNKRTILAMVLSCSVLITNSLKIPYTLPLIQKINKEWTSLKNNTGLQPRRIEKEIRKWDSWILDFIKDTHFKRQQNNSLIGKYSNQTIIIPYRTFAKKERIIEGIFSVDYDSAQKKSRSLQQEMKIACAVCELEEILKSEKITANSYLENINSLSGVQLKYLDMAISKYLRMQKEHNLRVAQSLDHELSHLVFDSEENSILESPHYQGPDRNEIKDYVKNILDKEKNEKAVNDIIISYSLFHLGNTSLDNKKFREIIEKEIFARKIDGWMSAYFGPSKFRMISIDQQDLEFFSRFNYKGAPMFRKSLEKNTIGLEMKKQGVNWKKIQEELEYAEKYRYKRKTYFWPENKFRLKQIYE